MATHVQLRGLGVTRTSRTTRTATCAPCSSRSPRSYSSGLVGAAFAFGIDSIQGSISAYYLGPMRDVFVGCMVGIAVCLVAYRGEALEDYALNLAGFYALFVAFVPTQLAHSLAKLETEQERADVIASLRVTIAAVLLVTRCLPHRRGADRSLGLPGATQEHGDQVVLPVLLPARDRVHRPARLAHARGVPSTTSTSPRPCCSSPAWRPPSRATPGPHGPVPRARPPRLVRSARTGDGTGIYQWVFWLMVGGGILIATVLELVFRPRTPSSSRSCGAGAVRRVLAHPDPPEVGSADRRGAAARDGRCGSRHLTPAPATSRRQRSASRLRAPTRTPPTATSTPAAIP